MPDMYPSDNPQTARVPRSVRTEDTLRRTLCALPPVAHVDRSDPHDRRGTRSVWGVASLCAPPR